MSKPPDIEAVLLDIDGVLHAGEEAVSGAVEALDALAGREIPHRFITNTSTRTPRQLADKLQAIGLDIPADRIFSAVTATQRYLAKQGHSRPMLVVDEGLHDLFNVDDPEPENPDAVVIGDIGPRWDHALLNRLFAALMQGAELVAMHRNRFWQAGHGLALDIGCYVAGLEYAADIEATVVGKPNAAFFQLAAADMEVDPTRCVMVGDDIESDVGGAQNAGMRGVLVQTGKYRNAAVQRSRVRPDATLPSIADLPAWLDKA